MGMQAERAVWFGYGRPLHNSEVTILSRCSSDREYSLIVFHACASVAVNLTRNQLIAKFIAAVNSEHCASDFVSAVIRRFASNVGRFRHAPKFLYKPVEML